ncbi:uncharacterized protein LTR77_000909 [Saxophila tyrrhenica]|uniref:Uncharacterized protein n=1 Tax=Saxophila tyrrhenica TaxID=1690608 RepID=A0AAV9PPC6_9PEZI|nr:hypothetical protein LTR77_000909 [Saxophila tyrrhenica]
MPTINEEYEAFIPPLADFSELLELPDNAFTASGDLLSGLSSTAEPSSVEYAILERAIGADVDPDPSYSPDDQLGNWNLPGPANDQYVSLEEPDYAKFENWIPQFIRPTKPCDYCGPRRLNCYITRGETCCTPCHSLFRECSLTNTRTLEGMNAATGHLLDTLHVVDEDIAKEQGTLTGIKPLKSKTGFTSLPSVRSDDAPGSSKRNGIRFPRHAVKVLRDWLDAHQDNPYPTEKEKAELEKRTELSSSQIANWLANARRRRKVTEKARKPMSSPSLKPTTPAIDIPAQDKPWDELNPLERWKNSPPEHDPASITDIANAVANSDLPVDQVSTSPSSAGRRHKRSSAGSGFSNSRAPSTTSFETGQTSSKSASTSAAWSQQSSQSRGSFGSFSSGLAGKKDRRRRRRPAQSTLRNPAEEKKRIFQCTFCTDTFKSKYDWTRHEKSLHLSLEKWICAPLGPVIADPTTGVKTCVYCEEQDPSDEHVETHNHRQCEEKGLDARTFYRKDHLRQHLRLMHSCAMIPCMDNWKSTAVNINSRCGFCGKRFTNWNERVDHLTAHFKAGARMGEWKGCRGLDPAVAAQVTNAMPPYLIGVESTSPNPFSATDRGTWREDLPRLEDGQYALDFGNLYYEEIGPSQKQEKITGLPAKSTCWEILTVRLGQYANEMAEKGIVLTDEMLQVRARYILYESNDTWNQTAADNPEWLDLFKKAHGLDFIPGKVGAPGQNVPEDLETYQDLGLRIPFQVQLKTYNAAAARHREETKRERDVWAILSKEGVLHDPKTGKCTHIECEDNIFDSHTAPCDGANKNTWRWCTYQLPPSEARKVAALVWPSRVDDDVSQQRAKNLARGLNALSHVCAEGECPPAVTDSQRDDYHPRHRYELPKERAQRFATTTGPWEHSGLMPPTISTAELANTPNTTSTGAMMEFLGGEIGQHLPFSADPETALIPINNDFDWAMPTTEAEEAAINRDIDRLIAETSGGQQQPAMTGMEFPAMTGPDTTAMPDFNFDMDMDFDGVFDMPMDDTFGPMGGS